MVSSRCEARSALTSVSNRECVSRRRHDDDPLTVIERVDDVRGDGFEYVDRDVAPGQTYRYQIGVVDADGEFFSPIVTVSVNASRRRAVAKPTQPVQSDDDDPLRAAGARET